MNNHYDDFDYGYCEQHPDACFADGTDCPGCIEAEWMADAYQDELAAEWERSLNLVQKIYHAIRLKINRAYWQIANPPPPF